MDKIRKLADALAKDAATRCPSGLRYERILRAELKPLLDAAQFAIDYYGSNRRTSALAAELQHWRKP